MDDHTSISENSGESAEIGKPTSLFNENTLRNAVNDQANSLKLLANCVYLVNATILRERKLIPAQQFLDFRVYENVSGYLVDNKTPEGKRLNAKLYAPQKAICEKLIHKLAIVVEETLNTQPVETFIWNFIYDSSTTTSAEIGYRGQKSKFTVSYNDMNSTCQQFCKLFCKVQEILKQLRPLPVGMVPSLKVAYRGEPEFINEFTPVDEFVNLEQIVVGDVAFPHNNGFQFSYASRFLTDFHRHQDNLENVPLDLTSNSQIEVARQSTMNYEDDVDFSNFVDPVDIPMDDDVANESMNCNPNVDSTVAGQGLLQSELLLKNNEGTDSQKGVHSAPKASSQKKSARRLASSVTASSRRRKRKSNEQPEPMETNEDEPMDFCSDQANETRKVHQSPQKVGRLESLATTVNASRQSPVPAPTHETSVDNGNDDLGDRSMKMDLSKTDVSNIEMDNDTKLMNIDSAQAEEMEQIQQSPQKFGRVKSLATSHKTSRKSHIPAPTHETSVVNGSVDDSMEKNLPKTNVSNEVKDTNDTEPMNIDSIQVEGMEQEQQSPQRFGRVKSLATTVNTTSHSHDPVPANEVLPNESAITKNDVIGEVSKEKDLPKTDVSNEKMDKNDTEPMKTDSAQAEEMEQEQQSPQRFGRVRSFTVLENAVSEPPVRASIPGVDISNGSTNTVTKNQEIEDGSLEKNLPKTNVSDSKSIPGEVDSKLFGRVSSIRHMIEQDPVPTKKASRRLSIPSNPDERFGRVSSIISVVNQSINGNEKNDEASLTSERVAVPDSRNYGRVSSLKALNEERSKKYGYSPSFRPHEET